MALTTPPPRHRRLDNDLDKLEPNLQFYTTGLGRETRGMGDPPDSAVQG